MGSSGWKGVPYNCGEIFQQVCLRSRWVYGNIIINGTRKSLGSGG